MARLIVKAIETSQSVDEVLLKAKIAIQTSNANLTCVLNAVHINPFTHQLTAWDGWRDDTWQGGRNVTKGFTSWVFDEAKKEAAERLVKIYERHGWNLHRFSYQKQSSAIMSLIAELKKADNQKDLTTLGLIVWYNEMVKAEEKFEEFFNLKAAHKNSKESAEKKEAQLLVNEDIEKLVIYINSIILFNTEDKIWNKIFNDIQGIVKQTSSTARARRSNQNNKTRDIEIQDLN